jgi:hypothetical protein
MKSKLKQLLFSLALLAAPLMSVAMPQAAFAAGVDVFSNCGSTGASGTQICGAKDDSNGFNKLMQNIISTLLVVLGMIAVVMIVIGGIRYTTSNGDPSQVKSAKDTILYAVVGLVVAIMAYAIVNFVISQFKK